MPRATTTMRTIASSLLLVAALAVAIFAPCAAAQETPPTGPTAEEVAAALVKLRTVFADGAFDERVAALTEAEACLHDDIVAFVAGAIKDDAREVKVAAAQSLGRMQLTSARQALHGLTKRKALIEDVELAVEIYKSIGRHANVASIDLLEDNALGSPDSVAQARILALGKIRDKDSVEALMGLMNRVRVAKGSGDGKHMQELRIALHVLTGVDQGNDRRNWQRWWNDSKHKLEVSAEVPELDEKLGRLWRNFWGEEEGTKRSKKDEPAPEPTPEPAPAPQPKPQPEPTPPSGLLG